MDEWLKRLEYLPKFMRDFHDQKDLFKRIDEVVYNAKQADSKTGYRTDLPNWISAHIYVIDFFLWFMARRGYTLQKSRKRLDYVDLEQDMREWRERELEQMKRDFEEILKERDNATSP